MIHWVNERVCYFVDWEELFIIRIPKHQVLHSQLTFSLRCLYACRYCLTCAHGSLYLVSQPIFTWIFYWDLGQINCVLHALWQSQPQMPSLHPHTHFQMLLRSHWNSRWFLQFLIFCNSWFSFCFEEGNWDRFLGEWAKLNWEQVRTKSQDPRIISL